MPKKNNVSLADGTEAAPEDVAMGKEGYERAACGHINRHYINTDGRLEDLACTLPKGHAGDHHAKAQRNVPDPIMNERGQVVSQRFNKEETDAYWGDAAGTPARDIQAGKVPQLSDYQKDLVMAVMKQDPDHVTVEMAIEQAKQSPAWMAGNV